LGYVPLLALHQVPKGLPDSSVLLHKFSECLFDGTWNFTIGRDHGWGIGVNVQDTPLLDSDAFCAYKRLAMKKTISKKENKKEFVTHLELCTRQSCLAHTHLSQGLAPPILTPMSL